MRLYGVWTGVMYRHKVIWVRDMQSITYNVVGLVIALGIVTCDDGSSAYYG